MAAASTVTSSSYNIMVVVHIDQGIINIMDIIASGATTKSQKSRVFGRAVGRYTCRSYWYSYNKLEFSSIIVELKISSSLVLFQF